MYILERRIFDRVLAERAAQAGAEVRVKTAATGLLLEGGVIRGVWIRRGDSFTSEGEVEVEARVVIAAILAMKPEIIIFDEPTTGQDYRGAKYILDVSRQLHLMGKTVIVITHHLYLMPEYAERVIVMGKGTILLDAPIREAYHAVDTLK